MPHQLKQQLVNVAKKNFSISWGLLLTFIISLIFILHAWTVSGFDSLSFDSDLGRDLKEISNITAGQVVWLGPWLGPGFHASSVYYYLFFPSYFIGGGHPHSLIYMNLLIGVCALGLFSILATRKYGYWGIVMMLMQGLSKWLTDDILHPGNGFTYALFSLLAVGGLWFKLPLYISSFAVGMATAFHPGAFPLLPLLAIETWNKRKNVKEIAVAVMAALIPWAPTIAFEIITKGYIIRSWLSHPSSGVLQAGESIRNIQGISYLINLNLEIMVVLFGVVIIVALWQRKYRLLAWTCITVLCVGSWGLVQAVPLRYFLSLAPLMLLIFSVTLVKWRVGQVLLVGYTVWITLHSPLFKPLPLVDRPISQVVRTANQFETQNLVAKDQALAVVAIMDDQTRVPQADDYRALLRARGYQVVDITQQASANTLVYFVEVPDFAWEKWSSWEVESFGGRKLENVADINQVKVVVFHKR